MSRGEVYRSEVRGPHRREAVVCDRGDESRQVFTQLPGMSVASGVFVTGLVEAELLKPSVPALWA